MVLFAYLLGKFALFEAGERTFGSGERALVVDVEAIPQESAQRVSYLSHR
jgi:hypothetical protein